MPGICDINKKDIIVKTLEQKYKANIRSIEADEVEMMKIGAKDETYILTTSL